MRSCERALEAPLHEAIQQWLSSCQRRNDTGELLKNGRWPGDRLQSPPRSLSRATVRQDN